MHVHFPVYLRTFEEHLKRQIQDPGNIEHFFLVCVLVRLLGTFRDLRDLKIYDGNLYGDGG